MGQLQGIAREHLTERHHPEKRTGQNGNMGQRKVRSKRLLERELVKKWTAEEVGDDVVHPCAVYRADVEVVLCCESVECTEQQEDAGAAGCLSVDDVDIGRIVAVYLKGTIAKTWCE